MEEERMGNLAHLEPKLFVQKFSSLQRARGQKSSNFFSTNQNDSAPQIRVLRGFLIMEHKAICIDPHTTLGE